MQLVEKVTKAWIKYFPLRLSTVSHTFRLQNFPSILCSAGGLLEPPHTVTNYQEILYQCILLKLSLNYMDLKSDKR